MRKIVSFLLGLIVFGCLTASAQYYSAGSDPIKNWKSISTEHYEMIYPEEIDSLARVFAANLEAVRNDAITLPQQVSPWRTPVILHPYTLSGNDKKRSNSPLRLDIYTSPDMYNYMSEPWEYTTAIAKSRHLGQEYLMNKGIVEALHYIMGDNIRIVGDAALFNKFFWMGDVNVAVTDLSHAGAGRNANFLNYYRTAFLEGDLRNYDRWKLGSYEYYTPEPDAFGYMLEANYRYQNDDYLFSREWADVVMSHPLNALLVGKRKDQQGAFMVGQFNEYRDSLTAMFRRDFDSRRPFTQATSVWQARNYTEYDNFSYIKSQDAIYSVKKSLDEADQLVKIDLKHNTEQFLMFFNPRTSMLTSHGNILYWSETVHKGPWELNDYSEIFSYNTITRSIKRLTKNTRFFNPVLNESGTVMAVSESSVEGDSYLTILSPSGKKELSVKAPNHGSIKEIVWMGDLVYCLIVTRDGLGLYSLSDDGWKTAIAPQWQNISDLATANFSLNGRPTDVITFTSDVDGVSNIYAYNPVEYIVFKLINSPYGVTGANEYKDGGMIYSRFGKTGYSIAKTNPEDFEMKVTDMSKPFSFPLADKGTELASNAYPKPDEEYLADYMDESRYPSHNYNKVANWFNVHSWLPAYVNSGLGKSKMSSPAALGAMVMSQNNLGTVSALVGYSYGRSPYSASRLHGFHAGIALKGNIPRIELKAEVNTAEKMMLASYIGEYGHEIGLLYAGDGKPFYEISTRLYQPLSYSMLGLNATLVPSFSYHHNNNKAVDYIGRQIGTTDYIKIGTSGTIETNVAHAAVYPRWGIGASLDYVAPAAFGKAARMITSQLGAEISAYLPGFMITHGVSVSMDFVRQNWRQGEAALPTATSLIELPRGYIKIDPMQFNSRKYWKGAIDYAAPILLGDVSLGGLMYFRRLQAIPFFDVAVCQQHNGNRKNFFSLGTDLMLDFSVARFRLDLSAGMRYSYNGLAVDNQVHTVQFLVNFAL